LAKIAEQDYGRCSKRASGRYFSEYEGFGMPPVEAILVGHVLYFQTFQCSGRSWPAQVTHFPILPRSVQPSLEPSIGHAETQLAEWGDLLLERHQWAKVADRFLSTLIELEKSAGAERIEALTPLSAGARDHSLRQSDSEWDHRDLKLTNMRPPKR